MINNTIELSFFAISRDIYGPKLQLSNIENLDSLLKKLSEISNNELIFSFRFAVDQKFINNQYIFRDGDKISVIPPSSGG